MGAVCRSVEQCDQHSHRSVPKTPPPPLSSDTDDLHQMIQQQGTQKCRALDIICTSWTPNSLHEPLRVMKQRTRGCSFPGNASPTRRMFHKKRISTNPAPRTMLPTTVSHLVPAGSIICRRSIANRRRETRTGRSVTRLRVVNQRCLPLWDNSETTRTTSPPSPQYRLCFPLLLCPVPQ